MAAVLVTPAGATPDTSPEKVGNWRGDQSADPVQAREIVWRDAKLKKVHFELARRKRWKFSAKLHPARDYRRRFFFNATGMAFHDSLTDR